MSESGFPIGKLRYKKWDERGMGRKRQFNPIIGKIRFSISALLPLLGKLVSKCAFIRISTILMKVNYII